MPEPELMDTQPHAAAVKNKKIPVGLPLLIVIVLIGISLFGGIGAGMNVRSGTEKTQAAGQILDQFKLGLEAMDEGNFEIARQHLEQVIKMDPNYPGAQAALADLYIRMQITPTITLTPTPSVTSTPDTRSADQQFQSAQELLKAGSWDDLLTTLDSIRKIAPDFKTTQIDGMYYQALYQRGLSKINPQDCHDINLEGGLYDLAQAERFGPLDKQIDIWRTYARLYIVGSSYWDQNWEQAQYYFGQVKLAFSLLMDSSCMSATERWRQATINYADELAAKGDFCGAQEQYDSAFSVDSPKNGDVYPRATDAADQCNGNSNEQPNQPTVAPTSPGAPSETPTLTPESPTPTNTPSS